MAEGVAVERLGRRLGEERMRQHARDRVLVDLARRRRPSFVVLRLPGPQAHEVVDQRIAGAGVEGDEIGVAVDEGHVGDAAEIEHADRMRALELAHQGAMEHRHDRGALPAGGDIGGAEVIDHGDPQPGGERRPIAELDREAAFGPVQDGLAVETDHADRARRHPVGGQERFHRLGMHVGHELFDLGEEFRAARCGRRDWSRPRSRAAAGRAPGRCRAGTRWGREDRSPRRRSRSARHRPRHRRCRSSDQWQ